MPPERRPRGDLAAVRHLLASHGWEDVIFNGYSQRIEPGFSCAAPRTADVVEEWTFPKGTRVKFGHLEHETTVMDWQGSQIVLLGFDELTHFDATQFWYMLSRNRSMCGVPPYVRATTNRPYIPAPELIISTARSPLRRTGEASSSPRTSPPTNIGPPDFAITTGGSERPFTTSSTLWSRSTRWSRGRIRTALG